MIQLQHERMSAEFEKWHVVGLPFPVAFHHFTGPDRGGPHDHPWDFTTHVLSGGYVERIWRPDGYSSTRLRTPGTVHTIAAEHIHEIVELPAGECWTMVLAGPHRRETRFWRFGEDGTASRAWHQAEFTRYAPERAAA